MGEAASGPIGSARLTVSEIAALAKNAGFTGDNLITAVSIALAESSGNPNAHGDKTLPGQGSFGLWQIYSYAHPEFGPDFSQLYDPQTNANAAYRVFRDAGYQFTPWSTFKNDAYMAHIGEVTNEVSV